MSSTDIGIAIVSGNHVLSGPFLTKQARSEATYNELNRVISAFVQAGFFKSERPDRKWDNGFVFAPGPNAEALLGFPTDEICIRHDDGALTQPCNSAPGPRKCPLCGKHAMADWNEWHQVFDQYGGNNLADSPLLGGEPQLNCASCGRQVRFTSLGTSIADAAEHYGGTVEDCPDLGEEEGPPSWGRMLGRIIVEATGWSLEFDEMHIANTLEELLEWKDVSAMVTCL